MATSSTGGALLSKHVSNSDGREQLVFIILLFDKRLIEFKTSDKERIVQLYKQFECASLKAYNVSYETITEHGRRSWLTGETVENWTLEEIRDEDKPEIPKTLGLNEIKSYQVVTN